MHVYIYIYMHTYTYIYTAAPTFSPPLHDRNLYTTTNKCLQCLIKLMYTVF